MRRLLPDHRQCLRTILGDHDPELPCGQEPAGLHTHDLGVVGNHHHRLRRRARGTRGCCRHRGLRLGAVPLDALGLGTFSGDACRFRPLRFESLGLEFLGLRALDRTPLGLESFSFEPFGFETLLLEALSLGACCGRAFGLQTLRFDPLDFGTLSLETLRLDALGFGPLGSKPLALRLPFGGTAPGVGGQALCFFLCCGLGRPALLGCAGGRFALGGGLRRGTLGRLSLGRLTFGEFAPRAGLRLLQRRRGQGHRVGARTGRRQRRRLIQRLLFHRRRWHRRLGFRPLSRPAGPPRQPPQHEPCHGQPPPPGIEHRLQRRLVLAAA